MPILAEKTSEMRGMFTHYASFCVIIRYLLVFMPCFPTCCQGIAMFTLVLVASYTANLAVILDTDPTGVVRDIEDAVKYAER